MKEKNIVIIGGGASGLFCALSLAERGAKNITVLERGERVGRKLSATGNGQGNLTNRNMGAERYFTDEPKKAAEILRAFDENALLSYFENLGGLFESDEKGRVYPTSRQASAITDLLRFALAKRGVTTITNCKAEKITKRGDGFSVICSDGSNRFADVLVMATGGKAAKNFGTDGTAYDLVKPFGHTVTPLFPALVQLKTDTTYIKALKGIRVDCLVKAYDGKKEATHVRGDVIFTDYGVSGNAVFFASSYLVGVNAPALSLEFLPDVSREKLTGILEKKSKNSAEDGLLGCILNNQLGRSVIKRVKAEKGEGYTAADVANTVKDFRLKVTGTLGFDYAQVTRGGIPMSEVDDGLQSKKAKNLYFCGEILNVDGECGGYNLQWAFSSARRVANGIVNGEKKA
ncbi:MAG: aminoacetone oxidase family FAD-binding enzyme [Clostridia bacterium]|nr:aminoacetone oxidase family FAD-binding enzyme [Clostridia bacterium]